MKQQRVQDEYILEQYEPMTTKYWKRNKKPNINLLDCPFASDRQLEDQRFLIEQNRNPRGLEPGKNDKPRSIRIASRVGVSDSTHTKAKVLNKIVREASGVHNYTLVPPISTGATSKSSSHELIDPDTHPLMKPYREQSNTNPVMCSFGHRPKSASRTFHPGTMKIRLAKGEIAQPAKNGKNGFGLPPSILSKLLHAPKIHHPGEEYQDDDTAIGGVTAENTLLDPHNLFLSNDEILLNNNHKKEADHDRLRKVKSEKAVATGAGGGGGGLSSIPRDEGLNIGEQSWSTTFPTLSPDETGGKGQTNKSPKKISKYPKKFENDVNWNNHFHVIEKLSNEKFELKKSGIAELKLLPLKERLTRFAAISVRDSIPQPFCCEKKLTDSLVLNGRATDPRDLYQLVIQEQQQQHQHSKAPNVGGSAVAMYDRTANPFYDAEVEEDLKTIQRRYREKEEMKKMKLRKKMIQAAIESIPHVEYRPDEMVIAMAQEEEQEQREGEVECGERDVEGCVGGDKGVSGERGFTLQEERSLEEVEGKGERQQEQQQMKTKKREKNKKNENEKNQKRGEEEGGEIREQKVLLKKGKQRERKGNEKIMNYQKVYGITLGPLERMEATRKWNSSRLKSPKRMEQQQPQPVKDDSDPIFSHVMQPFQEYFIDEEEKEKMRKEWERERNEREELERRQQNRTKNRTDSADLEGEDREGMSNMRGDEGLYGEGDLDGEDEERYDDHGIFERNPEHEMEGEEHDVA